VGCDHLGSSCRLDAWIAEESESPARLASLRRLLLSKDAPDDLA
jgi:hypothetical protein